MLPRIKSLWLLVVFLFFGVCVAAAQDSTAVLAEDFDSVVFPDLPRGWRSSGTGWSTSDAVPSSGSGHNNLMHTGIVAGYALLPPVDLSRMTSATITYLARRTSAYRQDRLVVRASTDGGVTFPITLLPAGAALPQADGVYARISASLPAALLGVPGVVIRFEALGGDNGGANMRVDDVLVYGEAGGVVFAPDRLTFAAHVGTYQERVLVVENTLPRSVRISAPRLINAAFSITPGDAAVLEPGQTRSYTVAFAPQVSDAYSGAVVFEHDFGAHTIPLSGIVGTNSLGFSQESATSVEGEATIAIPLRLQYENATPLQGLAFSVSWDSDAVRLIEIVRGNAVRDTEDWVLSYEPGMRSARVVLLGAGSAGIPAGLHDAFLTLRFSGSVPQGVDAVPITFALGDVAGSLAVATGDAAGITATPDRHVLMLRKRRVVFELSSPSVDLGAADAGQSASAAFTVANTGGTDTLRVEADTVSNALFTITPASARVAPEKQQVFTVTFSPTRERFGRQTARLTLTHNAEGGPAEVQVSGLGQGGRGDGYKDGMVEAMDLVHLIDFLLGRGIPAPAQQSALDLYPFPSGDGQLTVHDATVVSHAIANGRWPDGVGLPIEEVPDVGAFGKTGHARGEVALRAVQSDGEVRLYVRHGAPLRALQVILKQEGAVGVEALPVAGATLLLRQENGSGNVRLLLYSTGGEPIAPGEYALATLASQTGSSGWDVLYATAVDTGRVRLAVDVSGLAHPDTPGLPAVPSTLELGAPYPNPFRAASGGGLSIPAGLPESGGVCLTLFDILGRRIALLYEGEREEGTFDVTWDGRDDAGALVPAGLYLLRLDDGRTVRTRTVVVVR